MQNELFSGWQTIQAPDSELKYWPNWLSPQRQEKLLQALNGLSWEQSLITIAGRSILTPRLHAWYGDQYARYGYSGVDLPINPWTQELQQLRHEIQTDTQSKFNSVLANLYRNGSDSVDWHADDESELGQFPTIASLSLGEPRKFLMRHRSRRDLTKVELTLEPGSLLVMAGSTQRFWLHKIPKVKETIGPRINLTFRLIVQAK
jgi:alkylated DNA repair dioxygenase AlkB